ncbi:MAG: hypothetical protein ACYDHM_07700 [Acidiferrobacterales bacterium]
MTDDGPTIRRYPTGLQRFVVEYRNCIYGPYTYSAAQCMHAALPKAVAAIERGYTDSPTYRKLTRQTARNPAYQERRRRIIADLSGFHYPYPTLQTRQPNCDDWMAPFVQGPIVLPAPEQVRGWQAAARTAAIDYRRAMHNRGRQPKASAKGAEERRRQGHKTAEEVLALAHVLRVAGIPSRKIAATVAAQLRITPRQVRNILTHPKGKYPRSV